MALTRSNRLANIEPKIVETEFECVFCKLGSYTTNTNIFLTCCSTFCHKSYQDIWVHQSHRDKCGHCLLPLFAEDRKENSESDLTDHGPPDAVIPPLAPSFLALDHTAQAREVIIRLQALIDDFEEIQH